MIRSNFYLNFVLQKAKAEIRNGKTHESITAKIQGTVKTQAENIKRKERNQERQTRNSEEEKSGKTKNKKQA